MGFTLYMLREQIHNFLITEDSVNKCDHLVVENWTGSVTMFKEANKVADRIGSTSIGTIYEQDKLLKTRSRTRFLRRIASIGIDTTRLILIPVTTESPRTLNNARAVIETARREGWKEFVLVTHALHSARSKEIYSLVARKYNIRVYVITVPFRGVTAKNWFTTPRGWLMAFIQMGKKIYYLLFVQRYIK